MVYSSLVQLLCILPKKSWHLLPAGAKKLASDKDKGISHYYPEKFALDMYYKRYYWQCEPELPIIDIELFKDVAKSLIRAGAAMTVDHADELRTEVLKLAKDQSSRISMQKAGLEWHKRNSGSSQRIAEQILESL